MTDETGSDEVSLPLPALERIETVCLKFEAAWKKGSNPPIEEYLGTVQGPERTELLRELLLLELDYRSRSDEHPTPDEYQARFPQDSQLVSDVFEELSTGVALAETISQDRAPASRQQTLPCQFGDYELMEVLGEGGMGIVYRARQQTPDRIVALKIIRPDRLAVIASEQRDKVIKRFRAETQAAASLEHEHIVPVYEVGQIVGQPFFSMRYIPGRGLEEVLRNGPLAGREAAGLLEPVARALHYAHKHDIVHRDIKPRNILLGTDGKPYIADFGLAKSFAAAQDLTQTTEAIGTPAYMSPEQAQGPAGVDRRTDVYGLGATLYELLTGRPPFRAATVAETQRQVVENEPIPPRQQNPDVDRDLETICLKCLEKEPAKRYATAEELAEELARYQQGRPIHARPITRLARGWRWCKRNRTLAFVGAAAAILLLVLAVGGPAVAVRFAALFKRAEASEELAKDEAAKRTVERNKAWVAEREADQAKKEAERRAAAERRAKQETKRTLYVGDMRLIQEYWELGHIEVCRRLLERYLPKPGEGLDEELRSFEWYYWWRQCHQDLMTLWHQNEVQQVAVSPNAQLLAAAETGGLITLWDLKTETPSKTFRVDDQDISALAFSEDGKTLAAAWGDFSRVTMRDVASGEVVYKYERSATFASDFRGCAAFDPDCIRFARSIMGKLYAWKRSGETTEPIRVAGGLAGEFISIQGERIQSMPTFAVPEKTTAPVKSWSRAGEDAPPPAERGGPVFCMAFSDGAGLLAAGGRQGAVKVWDLASGEVKVTLRGHEGIVWSLALSPDAKTLASAGADGKIVLWDIETGKQKTAISAHTDDVRGVAFVRDGKTLASAGVDSTIKFWDANTGRLITTRKGHEGPVTCLAPFGDGQSVASACSDGTVKLWSVPACDEQVVIQIPSAMIFGASFSPDGSQLAAAIWNDPRDIPPFPKGTPIAWSTQKLVLWDWEQRVLVKRYHLGTPTVGLDRVVSPAFSPDGALLAAGASLLNLRWDLPNQFPNDIHYETRTLNGHMPLASRPVGPGAFFPEGRTFAAAGVLGGTIELWNVPRGDHRDALDTQATYCLCVTVSPDGDMLAAAADQTVQLWTAKGRKVKDLEGHADFVRCVAFSRDGQTLVSASSDGTVKLWNVETGTARATLRGHKGGVSWVAISPDGKTIASAGRDGTIKLWDLESGEEKTTLKGHAGWVTSVAFSPDGRTLVSTSEDGTVRLWRGASDISAVNTQSKVSRFKASSESQQRARLPTD